MVGRLIHALCLGVVLVSLLGCGVGNVAFRQARKAELHKDYDTALIQYEKALQAEPDNALFLIHEKQARTQAAAFHVKQGRRLLASGRQDEAAGEFQKAVSIDPTNETAAQELSRLLAAQTAARHARETAIKESMKAGEEAGAPTSVQLKPFPAEPLAHFRISTDSRKVFETLCKLADLNVAFTSDFQPRPLTLDLTNVKVEDALRVVSFQTKTFWRPVTNNTILVVPDTPNNRRDFDEEVLKTIYLSNPLAPADRTAITTALKQVLGLQRIIDNPDSNAIIIRDTPAKVAAAEKMIRELDRGKAEVLVEVAILEADRSRVRDLGLIPGGATVPQLSLTFTPPTASGSTTTTNSLPLNQLGRLSSSDFSVILPGAIASALLNDTRTHVLQNPQVRVTDGQTAKLRIGTRIPYATGSFLPGMSGGTGGLNMLASTQFQYQDVGVNLDLTPHLLANGEVGLHAMIEISSLGASINIGGLSQPTFGQRRIEHDIRLKEGEVSLLGGLIQSTETRTFVGVPGLGQIPIFGHLFSGQRTDHEEIEVLVMLTPRVIRLPEARAGGGGIPVAGGEARTPGPEVAPTPEAPPPPPPGQPQ
jgi:general secretion pathway protein D